MRDLPGQTRAVVQSGPGVVAVRELSLSAPAGDAGLLAVEACGVCGTDVDQFQDLRGTRIYPGILGHEPVGRVAALGAVAAARWDVAVGDRVAVAVSMPCGRCRQCRVGRQRTCQSRRAYSTLPLSEPPGLWGGFAEYMHLDADAVLHRIPDELPAEVAVMYNSLANAVEWSLLVPGTRAGDNVLLLGCGQRALMSVIALRSAGAGRIVVTGLATDAHKLDLALGLGADAAVDITATDPVEVMRDLGGGLGADVVVDMTPGATSSLATAVEAVRPAGTVVLAGLKGGNSSPLSTDRFAMKDLTMRAGLSASYEAYERAIGLLTDRTATFAALGAQSFELAETATAIRTLAGETGQQVAFVNVVVGAKPAPPVDTMGEEVDL